MKYFLAAFLMGSTVLNAAEAAQEPLVPRIPGNAFDYTLPSDYSPARLVVKFTEGTGIRQIDGLWRPLAVGKAREELPAGLAPEDLAWQLDQAHDLLLAYPVAGDPYALFNADDTLLATLKSNGEQSSGRQQADLGLYFAIPIEADTTFGDLKDLLDQLNALAAVEVAYAEPRPELTQASGLLTTPDFMPYQGYLFAAPNGIDAPAAWNHNRGRGGRGTNVKVVDIEGAWNETHEDLPGLFYQGGTEFQGAAWENHGTAVLGEMAGVDNALGVHGIADLATYGVQSAFPTGVAPAIFTAAAVVGEGGIVVLELQAPGPWGAANCTCVFNQCGLVPMEYWQAEFDAIALASANCVTVVEAGGNGSSNLDHPIYGRAFDRTFRNSGALLVAASTATTRVPMCFTNQGTRMDFHAWGELVVTTGWGDFWGSGPNDWYTARFAGTSSATPIIAGAAAAIQGAQKGYGQPPLAPENILNILHRGATPSNGGKIGPMPNLGSAVFSLPYRPRICGKYADPQKPAEFPEGPP